MGVLLLLVSLVSLSTATDHLDGDVVIRCNFDFSNSNHQQVYQNLIDENREEVDLWGRNDIHLTQKSLPRISSMLEAKGISCNTLISDVQALIDAERIPSPAPDGPNPDPFFDNYQRWEEIHKWYEAQQTANPTISTFTNLNSTYEGKPIKLFKVTSGSMGVKPVILIHGLIHAREWISGATVAYILGKLLNRTDADSQYILNNFEFHFIPIVNVDGYAYTWVNSQTRSWRKTRRPNQNSNCIGTDPNRNWADHWCQQGASTDPCSDSYCGNASFSQQETLTVANHITNTRRTQTVRMYIDFHAYGQLWMAPWGWTNQSTADATVQANIGRVATNAIKGVNNLTYQYGTIYTIIYPASGSSADWVYAAGVTYAYGVELRDTGAYGFQLPASQIRPQGEEIWAAIVAMARALPK